MDPEYSTIDPWTMSTETVIPAVTADAIRERRIAEVVAVVTAWEQEDREVTPGWAKAIQHWSAAYVAEHEGDQA